MAQNMNGQTVDYETFKSVYDSDPMLQDLVKNFDNRGITIKTREKEMPVQGDKKASSIDTSAKRAAEKVIKR